MDKLMDFLTNPIISTLSLTLIHFIWQGVAIALLLKLILGQLDGVYSRLRYAASLSAMVLNLAAPIVTFFSLYQPQVVSLPIAPLVTATSSVSQLSGAHLQASLFPDSNWLSIIALGWMVGVFFLSLHLIKEVFNAYMLPRTLAKHPPHELNSLFQRLVAELKIWQPVRLLLSLSVDVPMVIGWLKPVILLPANMVTGLNDQQLAMLLSHELAHVKRYDYLVNFLQSLVELLLFYHPCVKWVSKQIRSEREYCCDDIAIAHCGDALAYANTLTNAELLRPHNIPQLAMAASGGDLKKRIFRAVGHQHCSPGSSGQWLAAFSAVVLVSGLLIANEVTGMTANNETQKVLEELEKPMVIIQAPEPDPQLLSDKNPPLNNMESSSANTESLLDNAGEVSDQQIPDHSLSSHEAEAKAETAVVVKNTQAEDTTAIKTAAIEDPDSTDNTQASALQKAPMTETTTENPQPPSSVQEKQPGSLAVTQTANSARKPALQKSDIPQETESQLASIDTSSSETASTVEGSVAANNQDVTTPKPQVQPEVKIAAANTVPPDSKTSESAVTFIHNPLDENTTVATADVQVAKASPEKAVVKQQPSITKPKLLLSENPYYPAKAIRLKLKGEVKTQFTVTTTGRVADIQFAPGSHRYLRRAVEEVLKNWRFQPATKDGKPVAVSLKRYFNFTKPKKGSYISTGSRIAGRGR